MATPESALRRLMRDTGKLLEPYGFQGSDPSWVHVGQGGVASVGRTRTFRSFTGGQQVLEFGLSLSATPIAWWEFCNWRTARLDLPATPLAEATGPGLIADNALPASQTEMWSLRMDSARSGHVWQDDVEVIRGELPRRVHTYARRALRLLEPDRYVDDLLAQPDPKLETWEAIVVLLADQGPSPRLEEAMDQLLLQHTAGDAYAEEVIAYAQARAVAV